MTIRSRLSSLPRACRSGPGARSAGATAPTRGSFALRPRPRACRRRGHVLEEPEEWLIAEWRKGEKEPTKFWLSTLPEDMTFERTIDITMMRWRIERDYQELEQEVGLGHFEGRSWRGFHHHATMCIAAYGFLVAERGRFSPSAARSRYVGEKPALPRRLPTQGLPRSGLSATSPTRSQPSGGASNVGLHSLLSRCLAAPDPCRPALDAGICDRVRLDRWG